MAIQGKVDSTDCVCIKNAASGDQLQKVILKARIFPSGGIDVRVSLKILFLCGCLSVHPRRSSWVSVAGQLPSCSIHILSHSDVRSKFIFIPSIHSHKIFVSLCWFIGRLIGRTEIQKKQKRKSKIAEKVKLRFPFYSYWLPGNDFWRCGRPILQQHNNDSRIACDLWGKILKN